LEKLSVKDDESISFESIRNKRYYPASLDKDLQKADLLILPFENFRDNRDLFAESTRDFYAYAKKDKRCNVDIAATDKTFNIIELHDSEISLPMLLLMEVVLPIAVNLISNFISERIEKYHCDKNKTPVAIHAAVEETKTKKVKRLDIECDASELPEVLKEVNKIFKKHDK